jgi:uncharacterized protein YndB with AHSA1/START domain
MKLEHTVRYDAPVAEVYAMLTDPAFREEASWAQDTDSVTGTTTTVHQSEDWRDGEVADFTTDTPGKPVGITGIRRLVADGDGTRDTFEGEAKAKVPLIGGKIERLIAERLKQGWDIEHGIGVPWLAGGR